MDMDIHTTPISDVEGDVRLDEHDSVRTHVSRRLASEVAQLEQRVETLKRTKAPHRSIMVSTYQRMIERKKGFMRTWGFKCPK